jgi:urease accessory protein
MIGFLTALQQADSGFPSGSFAFSNGIEGLAALGAALGRDGLAAVVATTIRHRWGSADRVAVVHAHRAGDDLVAIAAIDAAVEAASFAEPLRSGSKRNGGALLTAHVRLGTRLAFDLRSWIEAGRALGHLPVVQGFIWAKLGVSEQDSIAISGYTTAAGLIAAAVRLGQVGAIEAQAVLALAIRVAAETAEQEIPRDIEIASFTPWLDIAAARQARAQVRLFAN